MLARSKPWGVFGGGGVLGEVWEGFSFGIIVSRALGKDKGGLGIPESFLNFSFIYFLSLQF